MLISNYFVKVSASGTKCGTPGAEKLGRWSRLWAGLHCSSRKGERTKPIFPVHAIKKHVEKIESLDAGDIKRKNWEKFKERLGKNTE